MKTIIYSVIAIAVILTICFIVSLIRGKKAGKAIRLTNLILPLIAVLLFVGLFVGGSISRQHLRKELMDMTANTDKRVNKDNRLSVLEKRNNSLSYILGTDEEADRLIKEIKTARKE